MVESLQLRPVCDLITQYYNSQLSFSISKLRSSLFLASDHPLKDGLPTDGNGTRHTCGADPPGQGTGSRRWDRVRGAQSVHDEQTMSSLHDRALKGKSKAKGTNPKAEAKGKSSALAMTPPRPRLIIFPCFHPTHVRCTLSCPIHMHRKASMVALPPNVVAIRPHSNTAYGIRHTANTTRLAPEKTYTLASPCTADRTTSQTTEPPHIDCRASNRKEHTTRNGGTERNALGGHEASTRKVTAQRRNDTA